MRRLQLTGLFLSFVQILVLLSAAVSASKEFNCDDRDCDRLVGLWHFDEDSGDSPNHKHNGPKQCVNKKGKIRNACLFNGIDDYLEMDDRPAFDLENALTISIWINPSTLKGTHDIVTRYQGPRIGEVEAEHQRWKNSPEDIAYQLRQKNDRIEFRLGRYFIRNVIHIKSKQTIEQDEWTHLVAMVDDNGVMTLYINGVKDEKQKFIWKRAPGNGPLYFGGISDENGKTAYFEGAIDEAIIFERALSEEEILLLFNYGHIPKTSSFSPVFGSTDFSSTPDLTAVPDLVLANAHGKIEWQNVVVDVTDVNFDAVVSIGDSFVSVDTNTIKPSLNTQTVVTINGVSCPSDIYYAEGNFATGDSIVSAGGVCPPDVCSNVVCQANTLTFTAQHFTGFASGPGTNLTVYDEIESSGVKFQFEDIVFFANYTNTTDGSKIPAANCTAFFDDAESAPMVESSGNYNYSKSGGFAGSGTHSWNVTCSKTGFAKLNATDTIDIAKIGAPEFSTWVMIVLLGLVFGVFVAQRKRSL